MESDGDGYFVSGGEESSGDFACLPDDPEDGGEELDFYAEGTTEKWTPQEASARMKGFIKDYKSVHGERSLGHIDQVTRNVIQLALNPYLFLNKKERQIWGVRPKHSMILTINTNSFFELPDKLELKLGQTNLNFFLLDEVGGYQSPLNSLLSRRIIEDLYQYLKNYTSSESWRKTLNQASETDDGYPSNVLIHITDHFVRKCTEILNPAHCVICGFIAPNHTGHNITVNGVPMGPGIQAEKMNRSPPVPQVLHPNCWNKFYEWFNPYEVIDNFPNVADTILFFIHAMQTYNIFQGTITLPSYIPEHLKTNNQFALTQDAYGNYQVPWTYAPQRVALFPEVSKLNPKVFGQSELPPENQRNQYGYHNNRYHQNLMELDRALLTNFMYLPCTLVEDEKTFHKHIQSQYSICCNSKDELRVFARKKAETGSYLAFMQLDYSANFQLRYGIHDIPNPWINPTRGIHLAKDTEKFKPTVPHAHNPYGMQMWQNTKNKVKPGFWKMNNNVQQNPFGVTYGAYNVPFFLCEVLNNPEFQNEEDDAKKGWILCKSRDDVIPLFLVFLNDNLKIEDIEVNTMNIIESQQWEERINGLWDVVRWLVMGSSSLTWVIEYHSVLQGLPIDLILTVCTTMINSGLV